jgi:hypothetical protein
MRAPSVAIVSLLAGCATAGCLTAGCATSEDAPAAVVDASSEVAVDAPPADAADTHVSDGAGDAACTLVKPYSSKDATCNACAQAKCCAEVNGCLGDPRCDDDYVNCILACALTTTVDSGDAGPVVAACVAECGTKYPAGKAAYDKAIGCVDARCSDVCK